MIVDISSDAEIDLKNDAIDTWNEQLISLLQKTLPAMFLVPFRLLWVNGKEPKELPENVTGMSDTNINPPALFNVFWEFAE